MTVHKRIALAAFDYMNGGIGIYSASPGYCLRVTREIVQAALGIDFAEFYGLITERVEENPGPTFWARDLQRALRNLGYTSSWEEREAGMLVFDAGLALQGHVGVLMTPDHVMENTGSSRGVLVGGNNRLSHIAEWRGLDKLEFMRVPWAVRE